MFKLELYRFIKSKRLVYYLLCLVALILTNSFLQSHLDTNINDNLKMYNLFQSFNMFFFLISSFIFSTSFSNDIEKHYDLFYFNVADSRKYKLSKILVNLLLGVAVSLVVFILFTINLNVDFIARLKVLGILSLTTILTILVQMLIGIFAKSNLKAITYCFLFWFLLTMVNIIPFFNGMACYFDNNSFVNAYIAHILDVNVVQINNLSAIVSNTSYIIIILVFVALILCVLILISKVKVKNV